MAENGSHSLVVIGASAGGVEALTTLARGLPDDFPAAIAVVLHIPPSGTSVLPDILSRAGPLPAVSVNDGDHLEGGRIHVAPPDCHLIVAGGRCTLSHGPRENGHRPAIDPLFASAASAYGSQVAGVILSGTLDDGSAGLAEINLHGGAAVVQDPDDALYASMPRNALVRVPSARVAPVHALSAVLTELAQGARLPAMSSGGDNPGHGNGDGDRHDELAAAPDMPEDAAVGLSCPECGGSLWRVGDPGTERYRCRIGHAYSEQSLVVEQGRSLEAALWTALRALEERSALLHRMSRRARDAGHDRSAERFERNATEMAERADTVRRHVVPAVAETDLEAAEAG